MIYPRYKIPVKAAILIFVSILFLCGCSSRKPEPENAISVEEWMAQQKDSISDIVPEDDTISLEELCKAYSKNSVAADRKYAGQRLNVQGEISSIDLNPFDDTITVGMEYANTESLEDFSISFAYFAFDPANEAVYDLEVGQIVTLSGILESGGSVTIHFSNAIVYGQEIDTSSSFETDVSLVDYIGEWGDTVSQRCFMTIEAIDDTSCSIQINWSSDSSSETQWNMTGYLDKQTGFLEYQDCICYSTIFIDEEEWVEAENYWEGTGSFFFSDGYMNWQDDMEQIGDRCLFEKIP